MVPHRLGMRVYLLGFLSHDRATVLGNDGPFDFSFRQRIIVRPLALAILDWQNWLSSQRGPLLTL